MDGSRSWESSDNASFARLPGEGLARPALSAKVCATVSARNSDFLWDILD